MEDAITVACLAVVPVIVFLIIWALTPTVFWPMNHELYLAAQGTTGLSAAEVIQMTHRWVLLDWLRVALIAIGFISYILAISMPATQKALPGDGANREP